jgi:Cu(I)/Ag(I) efflux system membrane fusion protein
MTMSILDKTFTLTGLIVLALGLGTGSAGAEELPMERVLNGYEKVRLVLLQDSTQGVSDQAAAMGQALEALAADLTVAKAGVPADQLEAAAGLLAEIRQGVEALASAESLTAARDAFYEISKPLVRYRAIADGDWPAVTYCPMARKSWLQPEGEIGNPYHGQGMPRCGEIVES